MILKIHHVFFSVITCCCVAVQSHAILCDRMDYSTQAVLSSIVSWSFLQFMSIESVILSNHLILCHPLLHCLLSHLGSIYISPRYAVITWNYFRTWNPPQILFFFNDFFGVQLLYNVFISAAQQIESAVCIHTSALFWISFSFRSPQSTEQEEKILILCDFLF